MKQNSEHLMEAKSRVHALSWKGYLLTGLIKKFIHLIVARETNSIQGWRVLQSEISFEMSIGMKPIDTDQKKQTVKGPLQ